MSILLRAIAPFSHAHPQRTTDRPTAPIKQAKSIKEPERSHKDAEVMTKELHTKAAKGTKSSTLELPATNPSVNDVLETPEVEEEAKNPAPSPIAKPIKPESKPKPKAKLQLNLTSDKKFIPAGAVENHKWVDGWPITERIGIFSPMMLDG